MDRILFAVWIAVGIVLLFTSGFEGVPGCLAMSVIHGQRAGFNLLEEN